MRDTIQAALREGRARLATTSDSPDLDARRLLEHLLGVNAAHLIVHGRRALDAAAAARFEALIARRAAGEPLAYILGRAGFWTLDLDVCADVLVPRPDTETLVETALECLPADAPLTVADLGTGSGAIALALASERHGWRLMATDASPAALACARANARRLGLTDVAFNEGNWFDALGDIRCDAIISNPPYVAGDDAHLAAPELAYEPRQALVAPQNGLADLAAIAAGAPARLVAGGLLLLEHGAEQGAAVRALFAAAGFAHIETRRDLGGRERATLGHKPG